jgi:hypothetical protein
MGPLMPLDGMYTSAPQDFADEQERRPDVEEMMVTPGDGTLAPDIEPEAFDAAILAGLVTP